MRTHEQGFIALMSVIIISAILLILIFTLGLSSFFHRFDTLDAENKRVSLGLAEACVNAAMLKLAQDPSYVPSATGDCVSVGDTCPAPVGATAWKTCKICSITGGAFPKTIVIRAVFNGGYTNLNVVLANPSPGTFTVTNWSEVAANPAPACTLP